MYSTPGSRLQRAGSPAGCEAGRPPSERRQLARELSAEALAAEYDRSAESGYAEVRQSICVCKFCIAPSLCSSSFPLRPAMRSQLRMSSNV